MSNKGIHLMISYTHSRLVHDYKKITRFGGLVCVGGQSVVDYYMIQFYKKDTIFWGASVCWGLVCVWG